MTPREKWYPVINVFVKVNIFFYYFIYDKNIEKNQIFILLDNINLAKLNFILKISILKKFL